MSSASLKNLRHSGSLKFEEFSDAEDTVLIGLLRDRYYPTGLDHRTSRRNDGRPYRQIRYGG